MKEGIYLTSRQRFLVKALSATFGCLAAMPVLADSEIEALKRELAEQKQLIGKLLAAQESQKQINAKMEAQTVAKAPPAAETSPSGISVYGVADVNVSSMNSGAGHKVSFGSGGLSSSRIGVKGERGLGGDLKVVGLAEAGILLDTGSTGNASVVPGINNSAASSGGQLGTGSQLFSRQVYAGLASGRFGAVTIGRQYAGSYLAAAVTGNAMGVGFYGYSGSILPLAGMPTRVNNSMVYLTPSFYGLTGHLTYTTGSENNVVSDTVVSGTTKTNDKAGQGYDLALFFKHGPFNAALTSWNIYNASYESAGEIGLARKTGWQVAANYDFGVVKLHATAVGGKISGGNYESVTKSLSKSSGWSVSAAVPIGSHRIYTSYTSFNDRSPLNKDAKLWGLGYSYDLYANTKLYASWGKMLNSQNAKYSLADGGNLVGNVITSGFDPEGYMAGLNYSF